ncbi:30S ribosomal protein S5 [Coprothermobacter proteolyticus]|uniref:Small ribosomal subunit protein uS5 n=1 Tax=Coprothermobacter proteolyticus (strain ATCC 35245 / DSM 5265 / OCM 4 / BT) TaxID=309798 RepID=B5Y970_COPPD|nr:30S ribosomal protein S5 [Coprothermobacter proteolyticus]ACI17067.1 30S ribosomal protein S5 [Coprothermobacter proteolyticus DSM 5265]MBP8983369.1 30S ribosomal protein S5 [Coprothermobacter sp.]NLT83718.1 30S ribosomal protein S5 [Coprothermobacter proteolyticus]
MDMTNLQERVIEIRRVARVVKGGKRLRFRALVVVGDGEGHVGVGIGKAGEVPDAVAKAVTRARKNMIEVPLAGTTVPHTVTAKAETATVLIKPAVKGTGVLAGQTVRAILEMAGIKDVITKSMGSTNPVNLAYATMEALKSLKRPREVAELRGVSIEQILKR